jgi:hypothetical protein
MLVYGYLLRPAKFLSARRWRSSLCLQRDVKEAGHQSTAASLVSVFDVLRDRAARPRALAADAKRYEQELATLVCSLDVTLLHKPGDRTNLSREAIRL